MKGNWEKLYLKHFYEDIFHLASGVCANDFSSDLFCVGDMD